SIAWSEGEVAKRPGRDLLRIAEALEQGRGLAWSERHGEPRERDRKPLPARLHIRLLASPAGKERVVLQPSGQGQQRKHLRRREEPFGNGPVAGSGRQELDVDTDTSARGDRDERQATGVRDVELDPLRALTSQGWLAEGTILEAHVFRLDAAIPAEDLA